jgi:hypothetical protein
MGNFGHRYIGLAFVKLNGKYGYINKVGDLVVPLKYDKAENFNGYRACVQLNGKYGLIDMTGAETVPPIYDYISTFEYPIHVELNNKHGFIDESGEEVIPIKYDAAGWFCRGNITYVKLGEKYGYINTVGDEVLPFIYDEASTFLYCYANVTLNGQKGMIDSSGNFYPEKVSNNIKEKS